MKERYNFKTVKKYIIATTGAPTLFLKFGMRGRPHMMVDDIEAATKTKSIALAYNLIDLYRHDTGDDCQMAVYPIEISYDYVVET